MWKGRVGNVGTCVGSFGNEHSFFCNSNDVSRDMSCRRQGPNPRVGCTLEARPAQASPARFAFLAAELVLAARTPAAPHPALCLRFLSLLPCPVGEVLLQHPDSNGPARFLGSPVASADLPP